MRFKIMLRADKFAMDSYPGLRYLGLSEDAKDSRQVLLMSRNKFLQRHSDSAGQYKADSYAHLQITKLGGPES